MKSTSWVLVLMLCLVGVSACSSSGSRSSTDTPEASEDISTIDPDTVDDTADPSESSDPSDDADTAETCDDGIDNEGDGLTDCGDDECSADTACVVAVTSEAVCSDALDDDADGFIDCDDSDCSADTACQPEDNEEEDFRTIDTADANILWVSPEGTDVDSSCSFESPCFTIQKAVDSLSTEEQRIVVVEGRYREGFRSGSIPLDITGGAYYDESEANWKIGSPDHKTMINSRLGGRRARPIIAINGNEGLNRIHGLHVRVNPRQKGFVIRNASAELGNISVVSEGATIRTDNATVSLVNAVYSDAGDFSLTIKRSEFNINRLSGEEGTTSFIASEAVNVELNNVDANLDLDINRSRFRSSSVDGDSIGDTAFEASWSRLVYVHDAVGTANPSRIRISNNAFRSGAKGIASGIVLGGAFNAKVENNRFVHTGSRYDYALYAGTGFSATGVLKLNAFNNFFVLDNLSGENSSSYGIFIEKATNLNALNNTIILEEEVGNGYGLTIQSGHDNGLRIVNNLFYNADQNDSVHIRFEETPVSGINLWNNLFFDPSEGTGYVLEVSDGSYSQYDNEADIETAYPGAFDFDSNLYGIDPEFVDERYVPQSAEVIDGGLTFEDASLYSEARFDILGNPRLVDGDGDGTVTIDIGAFEVQSIEEVTE